jgi:hypothetical protein
MSDFFTVIVSNDDFVSLGMSTPQEASRAVMLSIHTPLVRIVFLFII